MRFVPAQQLVAFPKRAAGQVRALEQRASSRVRWTIEPGRDAYVSLVPLGTTNGCVCTYRVGVREAPDKLKELFHVDAEPVGPFAPAALEVDLSPYAGRRIDLLLQINGSAAHAPDQPVPSVLWGSPAVYSRKDLPAAKQASQGNRPNILLIGIDTLRADALGAWGKDPSLTPSLDRLAGAERRLAQHLYGLQRHQSELRFDHDRPLRQEPRRLRPEDAAAAGPRHARRAARRRRLRHPGADLRQPPGRPQLGARPGFRRGPHRHRAVRRRDDRRHHDRLAGGPSRPARKPFFVWLHLFDPHTPHTPPRALRAGRPARRRDGPRAGARLDPLPAARPARLRRAGARRQPRPLRRRGGLSRPPGRAPARLPGEPRAAAEHAWWRWSPTTARTSASTASSSATSASSTPPPTCR